MADLPKIVIIMPTYNEAKNIGPMIEELVGKVFPKIKGADMHLLIVDDNSPDGTGSIVNKYMEKFKNLHLLSGQKQKEGLGKAYARGMKHAMHKLRADAVMEMDSDFQHNPEEVPAMVKAYLDGADYVIGARYIKGGSIPKAWPLSRKMMSFFGNLFIRIVLIKPKLHDLTTGFRLTKVKGVLDQIDLDNLMEIKRFAYKVDLLNQTVALSKKVTEVPIHFGERKMETSKFNLKELVATFKVAIVIRLKESQRFIKFGTVGFIGYLVNAISLHYIARTGVPEAVAWAGSTELAIISNFTLNNIWTFKSEKISGIGKLVNKFIQFNGTSLGALVIQTVAGSIGVSMLGQEYRQILLPFIVVFLVLPYNYLAYNLVIWRTWRLPGKRK